MDAVLVSHPEVAQAVAFGVPDDKYGEEVRDKLQYCQIGRLPLMKNGDLHLFVCFNSNGCTWG